ncbi:hypothetical protein SAMN02799624_05422 [Paenibacillus sp. UNC496MF]|uniref:hypothetical protein n=1 Tax=Paenibacillus sp. UNC496MF TaxID=1502753 RepID=UPI0008E17885|nr:hypothetical protein [Paenibacillus sp. UNC496MF]SFJ65880.1 hypothetical protein SAMN02799624_05422 [Paenibacillus sp. UNC496MF]
MARERISLVPEEVKTEATLRSKIESGELNAESYAVLPADEQELVNKILFDIAAEKVNPAVSASILEFTLFSFMRVVMKRLDGMSLTAEDEEVLAGIKTVMGTHEITNGQTLKANWLFDYLGYASENAKAILANRADYIQKKKNIIGRV